MRGLLLLVLVAGRVSAVPHASLNETHSGAEDGAEEGGAAVATHRLLQAATPDRCTEDSSFQAWLAVVNQACCQKAASACTNGLPSSCAHPGACPRTD